jgi:hypothetical protein
MYTDVLYARPSLLTGVARLFDFWGLFDAYNTSRDTRAADAKALAADWRAVGADLQAAIDRFADEHPELQTDRS